jgi:hypothetical protein
MMQPRGFEQISCERHGRPGDDNCEAVLKTISTDGAAASQEDPHVVRGQITLAGFVARPVPPTDRRWDIVRAVAAGFPRAERSRAMGIAAGQEAAAAARKGNDNVPISGTNPVHCVVTYVAVVDPKGVVPPALVNLVVGKQTATLRLLQRHALMASAAVTTPPQAKL